MILQTTSSFLYSGQLHYRKFTDSTSFEENESILLRRWTIRTQWAAKFWRQLQLASCPSVLVLSLDGGGGSRRNAFKCLNISFGFSALIACPASFKTTSFASSPMCLHVSVTSRLAWLSKFTRLRNFSEFKHSKMSRRETSDLLNLCANSIGKTWSYSPQIMSGDYNKAHLNREKFEYQNESNFCN